MTRGANEHLRSRNHWKLSWDKFKGRLPPPDGVGCMQHYLLQRESFSTGQGDNPFHKDTEVVWCGLMGECAGWGGGI